MYLISWPYISYLSFQQRVYLTRRARTLRKNTRARRINVTSTNYENDYCRSLSWKAGYDRERRKRFVCWWYTLRPQEIEVINVRWATPIGRDARNDESRYFEMCARIHTVLSTWKTEKFFYWRFNRTNLFFLLFRIIYRCKKRSNRLWK